MSETVGRHRAEALAGLNFVIIVCSSSRYRELKSGKTVDDPSGDLIATALRKHGHAIVSKRIVPDDMSFIRNVVRKALDSRKVDVVIACGGTGISPSDLTIEAVQPLLEKELPGYGEVFRRISYEQIGSAAVLSRAIAGVWKGKAVFCVPGSPHAVSVCLERIILPEVGHIVKHSREK